MRVDDGILWAGVMSIVSAIGAAIVGLLLVDVVFGNPVGTFDVLVVPPAVVAAGALGGILWWAVVERPHRWTDERAVAVGFLVGILSHPLMWGLYLLGGPLFLPGGWSAPRQIVEATVMFSFFSVLLGGFLTIIGGVLCGLVVMRCRRYAHHPC